MVLRKSFYIRWSAGRSPRVHEVNPGRDPSLWDMTIARALRWGVASIRIIIYWAWLTLYGKIIQVQEVHRWTTLIRGRYCKESQIMAFETFCKL